MKKFLITLSIVALSVPAFAQAKKETKPMAKTPVEEVKPEKKPREAKTADDTAPRHLPMNARVDMMDAAAKTFTMKRKDGVEIKHMITDKTEIMQAGAPAKLSDIKVGDVVAGLRVKKTDTEYEVVKITKFGPKAKKEMAETKTAETKTAEKEMAEKKPVEKMAEKKKP